MVKLRGVRMRRLVLSSVVAAFLPLLSACDRFGDEEEVAKAPAKPVERGMPLKRGVSRPVAETGRMHAVAGRWKSDVGVLKGGPRQWILLEVANDRSFALQVREPAPDGVAESVDVNATGRFEWSPEGVIVARAEGAAPPLRDFSSWRGSFPSDGVMVVAAGDRSYRLSYQGL